ncbi:MAG TPA: AAA family ATPase [Chloroflexota bacterium]|nr:AAA family ATPase [Chloroflexota bacterium]
MDNCQTLVGREQAWTDLNRAIAAAASGRGGLVLLAGEAGVGKTRLATEALDQSGVFTLRVTTSPTLTSAYGPLITALRNYRHGAAGACPGDLPMADYLGVLLPELGSPPAGADRATVFEAVRCAFEAIARRQPTVVFLDDLQWADHTTLELLASLASHLESVPLLLVGAYRSDELGRDHPVRRMRSDLRRAGRFAEIRLEPLRPAETAVLAARLLGPNKAPTPELAALLHAHTDGLPFFVEELVAVLRSVGRLRETDRGVALAGEGAGVPVPETVRDVVLLRTAALSDAQRAVLEVASVAGVSFELDLVAEIDGSEEHLGGLLESGLLVEPAPGIGAFRHALIREACYREIAWPRRRALHRRLAERLERRGAAPGLLAEHWLAARELDRARHALLVSMQAACAAYAYGDAVEAAQRALELWPEGDSDGERTAVVDRLGYCAQVSGDLAEAVRAWREVAEVRHANGDLSRLADVQRRLGGVYELQGSWERALAARETAATAFAASGQPGEAAAERLAAAAHLRSALRFKPALELLGLAAQEARLAGRLDLDARILGLEGNVRARMGQYQVGLEQVRTGLAMALERNLSGPAAEIYQRLADSLEHSGDYAAARQSYLAAADFCQARGAEAVAQLCLACMTVVLRQTGEWERCAQVCRDVLGSGAATAHAHAVALGMLGLVFAQRGEVPRARPLLFDAEREARKIELVAMELLSAWGLAMVDDLDGRVESAANRCRGLLELWARTDERHYAVPALRWAASLLAACRADEDLRACANALARIVAETGTAEAVAALGHALGEVCRVDGNLEQSRDHFLQALKQLDSLDLPYERAHSTLRAGLAQVAAGDRSAGIEQLADAYRRARNLGARPLAAAAARELQHLGESVERRLGRRAGGLLERGGLTRREVEVLRLVASGQSDREIARALVLSPRTVEMHVSNSLGKLGCRSRAEAVRRAAELRLLDALDGAAKVP